MQLKRIVAFALMAAACSAPHAATFVVDTAVDEIDVNLADGVCNIFFVGNACSLRAAVMTANENPGADTIVLPAALGPYALTLDGTDGDVSGDLDITGPTTIAGEPPEDATGSAVSRLAEINGTELHGVNFHAGERLFDVQGGASLFLAGVHLRQANSEDGGGGAVRVSSGSVIVSGSVVSANSTSDGPGGAFFVGLGATLYLQGVDLFQNTLVPGSASFGAAVANYGTTVIADSSLRGNYENGNAQVYTAPESTLEVRNTTFHGVSGPYHSAIAISADEPASLEIDGVTFSTHAGTALVADVDRTPLAPTDFRLERAAFDANATDCLIGQGAALVTTNGRNWFEDGGNCTVGATNVLAPLSSSDLLPIQTRDDVLTWYRPLTPQSALVDAGGANGVVPCNLPFDQRGVLRPQDGNDDSLASCDVGAFEYHPTIDDVLLSDGFEE